MHFSWKRSDIGYYYEGKGWVRNAWQNGFKDAPISEAGCQALMQMEHYRSPPPREDWDRWLDSMTYQRFLTDVVKIDPAGLPEVLKYINPVSAAMGCGLGADVISAYSAWSLGQPGTTGYGVDPNADESLIDSIYLASFPGGNTGIARYFLKTIMPAALTGEYRMADILNGAVRWDQLDKVNEAVRMRLSSVVVSVVHEGPPESAKGVIVTYAKGGKLYRLRARAAILCGQQHVNRHICRDISPKYRAAMPTFHHAPMLTVNVAVRNWKFMESLGVASARWFEGFGWWVSLRRNLEIPGQSTQPLDPAKPMVLTMYNPFCLPGVPFPQQCTTARMQLFGMTYAQIESAVRDQFTRTYLKTA
jgi:spermidine dehydrogenase